MTTPLQTAIHTAQQLSPYEQLELIKTMSQFLQRNDLPTAPVQTPPPRNPWAEVITVEARSVDDVAQQQQVYLQRVNQLYANIQDWLREEPLVVTGSDLEIEEALGGCYLVPRLIITTDQGEPLADFKPAGATVIGASGSGGLIMVNGWIDRAYLLYWPKNGHDYNAAGEIKVDGWYWEERYRGTPPHLFDKEWLLKVITWVSDYEFH